MRFDRRKLLEIQILALQYHQRLISHPQAKLFEQNGGFLIGGDHYAAPSSRKMFFGLNGKASEDGEFFVGLMQENGPWDMDQCPITSQTCTQKKESLKRYKFLVHCNEFFNTHRCLRLWIQDATSTFVVPWPTPGGEAELKGHLLWRGRGIVWEYSKNIVCQMVEHCNPSVIIASGVFVRETLEDFLGRTNRSFVSHGRDRGISTGNPLIIQIPHFSRFSSSKERKTCVDWLCQEVSKIDPSFADCLSQSNNLPNAKTLPSSVESKSPLLDLPIDSVDGNQILREKNSDGIIQLWESLKTGKFGVAAVKDNNRWFVLLQCRYDEQFARQLFNVASTTWAASRNLEQCKQNVDAKRLAQ